MNFLWRRQLKINHDTRDELDEAKERMNSLEERVDRLAKLARLEDQTEIIERRVNDRRGLR